MANVRSGGLAAGARSAGSKRRTTTQRRSPVAKRGFNPNGVPEQEVASTWQPGASWDPSSDNDTGFSQGTSKGYDAQAAGLSTDRRSALSDYASAYLLDGDAAAGGLSMPLYVTATNIDTSLGGQTAQSQLIQDFYPKNFIQTVISVYGISPDQSDYGALCEFVHHCQWKALSTPDSWPGSMSELIILGHTQIFNNSSSIREAPVGSRTKGRRVEATFRGQEKNGPGRNHDTIHVNQTIKGDHNTMIAKGFVSSMPRIHQQFQYATLWQFDFAVAQMLDGTFRDGSETATNIAMNGIGMWQKMLQNVENVGFSSVSSKENKASLAYASKHSATLNHVTPTGG